MKIYWKRWEIPLLLCPFFFSMPSCTEKTKPLETQVDSLRQVCRQQETALHDMSDFMATVSSGLDSLAVHEAGLLLTNQGEGGAVLTKQELKKRLDEFGAYVGKQKMELESLRKQLEQSESEHAEQMRKLLENYEQQLTDKDQMIASLRKEIEQNKKDISKLKTDVSLLSSAKKKLETIRDEQEQTLKNQDEILNQAYVSVGTTKELKAKGILTGGFLAKKKVDPSKMNASNFNSIDIRKYNNVTLNSKKPKLMPQRPASSYTLTPKGDGTSVLTITDPATFWGVSNFLVIRL